MIVFNISKLYFINFKPILVFLRLIVDFVLVLFLFYNDRMPLAKIPKVTAHIPIIISVPVQHSAN